MQKSFFRLYAKTSPGNQPYLFEQLRSLGINAYYQQQLNAFYFRGNFENLLDLSFKALTAEHLLIQLGHRFTVGNQRQIPFSLQSIPFYNYLPLQKGLIENLSIRIVSKKCKNIPSEAVLTTHLRNHLQKQIILREYKKSIIPQIEARNHEFKEIKYIVHEKWQQEDRIVEQKQKQFLLQKMSEQNQLIQKAGQQLSQQVVENFIQKYNLQNQLQEFQQKFPYNPYLIFYIRKNQGRILLKINRQQMYKHGWKKQISWGSLRQSIASSILRRTKIIEKAKQQKQLKLWDPFCGSGTIPLVAASMLSSINIRKDYIKIFNWAHWPIFKQQYLEEYFGKQKVSSQYKYKLLCSDISYNTINTSIKNFQCLLPQLKISESPVNNWLNINPTDQVYQMAKNSIYFICSHFEKIIENNLNQNEKINIITNLPYLDKNSSEHLQKNQLISSYRKFDEMLRKFSHKISNVYILINMDKLASPNHFLSLAKQQWILFDQFSSGGLPVGLYGWKNNQDQYNRQIVEKIQEVMHSKNEQSSVNQKGQYIKQYRQKIAEIEKKRYFLPDHLRIKRNRTWLLKAQKAKDRHLKAAYISFSKRRDRMIAYSQYSQKKTAMNLRMRGLKWRKKNLSLLHNKLDTYQNQLKKEFENRIEQALELSLKKKQHQQEKKSSKPKRIW